LLSAPRREEAGQRDVPACNINGNDADSNELDPHGQGRCQERREDAAKEDGSLRVRQIGQ
jgi:hypothetical protein